MVNVVKIETLKDGRITIKAPYIEGLKDNEVAIVILAKCGNRKTVIASAGLLTMEMFKDKNTIQFAMRELEDAVLDKTCETIEKERRN